MYKKLVTSYDQNGNISYLQKTTSRVSLLDGKFIVLEFLKKSQLLSYYVRMLTQSFFPIFVSFFVSWWCFQLIGSAEAERSFSCLRQIHSWLRTTMTDEKLGNLVVFDILLNGDKICE